jgi:hypothetical protein
MDYVNTIKKNTTVKSVKEVYVNIISKKKTMQIL